MIDFLFVGIGYALYMALRWWMTVGGMRLRVFGCVCGFLGVAGYVMAELRQMEALMYLCVLIAITALVDLVTGNDRDN